MMRMTTIVLIKKTKKTSKAMKTMMMSKMMIMMSRQKIAINKKIRSFSK